MDVVAACSGFLYGVALANSMIQNGQSKYALVIGSEILTQYVDYTDRQTCVLFGDGAGAACSVLLKETRDSWGQDQIRWPLRGTALFTRGGTRRKPTAETLAAGDHFFKMKGNELFKVAFAQWLRSRATFWKMRD
jgi:3-oxoacyl-[acyl-carrier-protein] synthase-3